MWDGRPGSTFLRLISLYIIYTCVRVSYVAFHDESGVRRSAIRLHPSVFLRSDVLAESQPVQGEIRGQHVLGGPGFRHGVGMHRGTRRERAGECARAAKRRAPVRGRRHVAW